MAENNKVLSWNEFKAKAVKIDKLYNRTWLKTEYHHTIANAKATADFLSYQAQSDLYPNLTYNAVADGRTRPQHMAYNGHTAPVNDPIWNKLLPPNDWGCRCSVSQTDNPVSTHSPKTNSIKSTFQNNPATSGEIFPQNSAYSKNLSKSQIIESQKFAKKSFEPIKSKAIFEKLNTNIWHKEVFYPNGGFVAVHKQRLAHSKISKNETQKFNKELRMSKVYAQNGFKIQMLEEIPRISSPDVLANGIPAELKSLSSHNNIVKEAKKATQKQGAKIVLFEFKNENEEIYKEMDKFKKLKIKNHFYFKRNPNNIYSTY